MKNFFWGLLFFCLIGTCFAKDASTSKNEISTNKSLNKANSELEAYSLMSPDIYKIKMAGVLKVGISTQFLPPFIMTNSSGDFIGLDINIAKDIAKNLNVELVLNTNSTTFNELIRLTAQNEVDFSISCLSKTSKRSNIVNFTIPYTRLHNAIIINKLKTIKFKDAQNPITLLANPNMTIGIVKDSSYEEFSRNEFGNAQIIAFPTWEQVSKAVISGEICSGFFDDNQVNILIRQKPELALNLTAFSFKDKADNISIAVNWQKTHLLTWLNSYIESSNIPRNIKELMHAFPDYYTEKTLKTK